MNIYELIKNRRTIRKFKQTPISEEQILRFIDAARVAPSGANLQPLKYIAVNTKEMTERLFPLVKWAAYLAPDYIPKEGEKPTAYIAVFSDLSIRKSGFEADMGAAVENLILAAFSEGVGSCWMGSVDFDKAAALLNPGKDLKLLCVVALGYPAESPEETAAEDGDIKYFLDESGVLNVPKRDLKEILIKTL